MLFCVQFNFKMQLCFVVDRTHIKSYIRAITIIVVSLKENLHHRRFLNFGTWLYILYTEYSRHTLMKLGLILFPWPLGRDWVLNRSGLLNTFEPMYLQSAWSDGIHLMIDNSSRICPYAYTSPAWEFIWPKNLISGAIFFPGIFDFWKYQ